MIRDTRESDLEEVFNLIHSAFGDRSESDLVKQLISDGDVLINLLFESSDRIIGNVVVSKINMRPALDLFCGGVAPISVLPNEQSYGVGSELMAEAINKSKKMGMNALFVLGNPDYYKKFGFSVSKLKNDYSIEYFQELELIEGSLVNIKSKVTYANAFSNLGI